VGDTKYVTDSATKGGSAMTPGTVVKVFGKHVCTVVSLHAKGKRAYVTGDYSGFVPVKNLKPHDEPLKMTDKVALDFAMSLGVEVG
jgi:hypothetical protein